MCGLCGMITNGFYKHDHKIFSNLLYLSALRGLDSTGVASADTVEEKGSKKLSLAMYKTMYDASGLLTELRGADKDPDLKDLDYVFGDRKSKKAMLGHCRAATVGSVSLKNAHPFAFQNVLGMHNGTIRGNFIESDKFGTDSEGIYNLINKHGLQDALQEVIDGSTNAAYTLTYIDRKTKTLNLIHNAQRPLFIALNKYSRWAVWASESWMISTAATRTNSDIQEIFSPKDNFLVSFDLMDDKIVESMDISEIKLKPKRTYARPTISQRSHWIAGKDADCGLPWEDMEREWEYNPVTRQYNPPKVEKKEEPTKASTKGTAVVPQNNHPAPAFSDLPKTSPLWFYMSGGRGNIHQKCIILKHDKDPDVKTLLTDERNDPSFKALLEQKLPPPGISKNRWKRFKKRVERLQAVEMNRRAKEKEKLQNLLRSPFPENKVDTENKTESKPNFNPTVGDDFPELPEFLKRPATGVAKASDYFFRTYNGKMITRGELEDIFHNQGCLQCGKPERIINFQKVGWVSKDHFYCAGCMEVDDNTNGGFIRELLSIAETLDLDLVQDKGEE